MKFCFNRSTLPSIGLVFFLSLASFSFGSEQRVSLHAGWNAIYLELDPDEPNPDLLFAGHPIEMVSLWLPTPGKVVSLTDPAAIPQKVIEWHTWQPASSPSAFLNNLRAIPARTPLLIKASEACQLTISGSPAFRRTEWVGASFNFVGFDIDPAAPPTFARFFDGSRAHRELKIYKLVAERWQPVTATEVMKRGVAYWVWTSEGSDFQGPVDLSVSGDGFALNSGNRLAKFQLRKNGQLPVTTRITLSSGFLGGFLWRATTSELTPSLDIPLTNSTASGFLQLLDGVAGSGQWIATVQGGGMRIEIPVSLNQ